LRSLKDCSGTRGLSRRVSTRFLLVSPDYPTFSPTRFSQWKLLITGEIVPYGAKIFPLEPSSQLPPPPFLGLRKRLFTLIGSIGYPSPPFQSRPHVVRPDPRGRPSTQGFPPSHPNSPFRDYFLIDGWWGCQKSCGAIFLSFLSNTSPSNAPIPRTPFASFSDFSPPDHRYFLRSCEMHPLA